MEVVLVQLFLLLKSRRNFIRLGLFFEEQQNGNHENGLDDDIVATFDKLMKHKRNTLTKRKETV